MPDASPAGDEPGTADGAPTVYVLASWAQRVQATLVDGALLLVPILALWVVGLTPVFRRSLDDPRLVSALDRWFQAGQDDAAGFAFGLFLGVWLLAYLLVAWAVAGLYTAAWMARTDGRTLGRRIARIRVVRADGRATTFWWSFYRTFVVRDLLFGVVSAVTCGVGSLVQFLLPLADRERRTLHDMLTRSRVVQDRPAPE